MSKRSSRINRLDARCVPCPLHARYGFVSKMSTICSATHHQLYLIVHTEERPECGEVSIGTEEDAVILLDISDYFLEKQHDEVWSSFRISSFRSSDFVC